MLCTNSNKLLSLNTFNRSIVRHIRQLQPKHARIPLNKRNVDYLGIDGTSAAEVSGGERFASDINDLTAKYGALIKKRSQAVNEQHLIGTTFGKVRLDSDNTPLFHGQYDAVNSVVAQFDMTEFEERLTAHHNHHSEPIKVETAGNLFEEQYFAPNNNNNDNNNDNNSVENGLESELNYIDHQIFNNNSNFAPLFKNKINFKFSDELMSLAKYSVNSRVNNEEVNEENFANKYNKNMNTSFESPLKEELFPDHYKIDYNNMIRHVDSEDEFEEQDMLKQSEYVNNDTKLEDIKLEKIDFENDDYDSPESKTGAEYIKNVRSGAQSPQRPHILTEDLRKVGADIDQTREKLDSKGFRIYDSQVFNWKNFTNEDIVEMLFQRILFNDSDVLAINKPYGLTCHAKDETKSGPVLTQFLPQLAERVECQQLYTVHRLDKETTGIMILAKTREKAHLISRLFAEHKICKQYWCITRGVPTHREGVIDIPIEVGHVKGVERMVLRPDAIEQFRSNKKSKIAKRAVTQYKVISEQNNSALLEVSPETGVKHQIRVHLGFGLRCPVLGDHKYSHLEKLAPQKLTPDMLIALKVRQSKVRHIPMHLHSRKCVLPQIGNDGKNIFIHAPLPPFFVKNLASLRLRH